MTTLCIRRLQCAGYVSHTLDKRNPEEQLNNFFTQGEATGEGMDDDSQYGDAELREVFAGKNPSDRPHLRRLHDQLLDIVDNATADRIVSLLSNSLHPLLEKMNVFLFYRGIADSTPTTGLEKLAHSIRGQCEDFIRAPHVDHVYGQSFKHFRLDLLAQVKKQSSHRQSYSGVSTFVEMSDGIPRNLLVILKNVVKWAIFNGEKPFEKGERISVLSQQQGVIEAADWFFKDVRGIEVNESFVRRSITTLAEFFRAVRFSDKPPEVSVIAFSFNPAAISAGAREILSVATNWSLLIASSDRKDRNSDRLDPKYQLNKILCPKWDLPVARRGTIALRPEEVNAIFDPSKNGSAAALLRSRLSRMNWPFGATELHEQLELWGRDEDAVDV